ncbi:MAG: anti-sigma factor [Acidimicrobiia bacterium]
MNADELDSLLGAYALDAVDDHERVAIDAYLANNPRARAEVAEHREVATMLAFSGAPAPVGLWDRIASSLEERAPAPETVLAPVLSLDKRRSPEQLRQTRRRRQGITALFTGAAVAAVAAIAVLGVKVVDQSNQLDRYRKSASNSQLNAAAIEALADPTARKARLVSTAGNYAVQVAIEDGVGYLLASDLPALPDDRTYQLWGVIDGKVISLGVLGSSPKVVAFPADKALATLVLTDEARGGVPVSAQPALAAGDLI